MKVIHIIRDDKFFDRYLLNYDRLENCEFEYVLLTRSKQYKFKWIKNVARVKTCSSKKAFLSMLQGADAVFLHSMRSDLYEYVSIIPRSIKVIWWSWGDDIYESQCELEPIIKLDMLKPLTQEWRPKREPLKLRLKKCIYRVLRPYYANLQKKALLRVDYLKTVMPIEFEILNSLYNNHYKPFDNKLYTCPSKDIDCITGKNIIIGNSSTSTCNHLDILDLLNDINIESSVVIPLSYGDFDYREYIKNHEVFKRVNNKIVIDKFMPLDEYLKILSSCAFAIYGNVRQQAIGNIIKLLYIGVKCFFYENSIIYKGLKKDGYYVYSIEKDLNEISISSPLSKEMAMHNRKLICMHEDDKLCWLTSEFHKIKS